MAKKKSMYEILGVSPTASLAEIKAAHKRLSLELMSGKCGFSREDCEFQLKVLDVALNTLSVPVLRDAYDAELAPITPGNAVLPIKPNVVSLGDDEKALKIVAAIEDNYKVAAASTGSIQFPITEVSSTVSASTRSLKKILRIIIVLTVLGIIGKSAFVFGHAARKSSEVAKAEEKIIIQEYYKKYGVRPASRAEAELLEKENRRKENEQRAAEFEEKRKEEEYRRFVEESRQIGDQVHRNLVREEERARYEEMQKQSELAEQRRQEEAAAQEAERERIERIEDERRKLGLN